MKIRAVFPHFGPKIDPILYSKSLEVPSTVSAISAKSTFEHSLGTFRPFVGRKSPYESILGHFEWKNVLFSRLFSYWQSHPKQNMRKILSVSDKKPKTPRISN